MKKFLVKILKSPTMMLSAGMIATLAIFIFLKPQSFVAGMAEFNPPQATPISAVAQESSDSSDDWSIWFMMNNKNKNQHLMLDLNGDGLTDYITAVRSDSESGGRVYINNGHGWDLVNESSVCAPGVKFYDCDGCFSDYQNWPKSQGNNENKDWDAPMPASLLSQFLHSDEEHKIDFFTDLNGDGLVDYIWKEEPNGSATTPTRTCVMLNNGHGWDIAYRCVALQTPDDIFGTRFYGDCAQQ